LGKELVVEKHKSESVRCEETIPCACGQSEKMLIRAGKLSSERLKTGSSPETPCMNFFH